MGGGWAKLVRDEREGREDVREERAKRRYEKIYKREKIGDINI